MIIDFPAVHPPLRLYSEASNTPVPSFPFPSPLFALPAGTQGMSQMTLAFLASRAIRQGAVVEGWGALGRGVYGRPQGERWSNRIVSCPLRTWSRGQVGVSRRKGWTDRGFGDIDVRATVTVDGSGCNLRALIRGTVSDLDRGRLYATTSV